MGTSVFYQNLLWKKSDGPNPKGGKISKFSYPSKEGERKREGRGNREPEK